MKAKGNIYGLKNGLNYQILAFDSMIGYLVKTEKGNFKWIPNNCFEYDEKEWKDFTESPKTILERINDFRYLYLPIKWAKENRKNKITNNWSIQLKSLTDKIGFGLSSKEENQEIGPDLRDLIEKDTLRFTIIKEKINQLGNIQYFLSDGYNIASMNFEKIKGENLSDKHLVALKYRQKINHQIDETKIFKIEPKEVEKTIKESMAWNLLHIQSFNNCNQLFEKEFHLNIYNEIMNEIAQDLITYSNINDCSVSIFKQFDSEGDRFIMFKTPEFNTIFALSNGIH